MDNEVLDGLLESMKKAAAALRDAGIDFALAGGLAGWARGGPAGDHDVDFVISPADADAALEALDKIGMAPDRPPEGWLVKAWDGEVMIDLIHQPAGLEVTADMLARSEEMTVHAMPMRVLSADDILTTKLMALAEHGLDYDGLLEMSRALREQVNWKDVRERTSTSPYARAFFTLAEGLGICEI